MAAWQRTLLPFGALFAFLCTCLADLRPSTECKDALTLYITKTSNLNSVTERAVPGCPVKPYPLARHGEGLAKLGRKGVERKDVTITQGRSEEDYTSSREKGNSLKKGGT
uniref:Uncharacterized protein n=1 Tax=Branchiostoma floridae TaxID=7739 RepID=C3ZEX8_BRAFL|eukprot:XP_002593273.1 hypothetical protein BRAFLDRAFT_83818 [Branchiostoma floridae]